METKQKIDTTHDSLSLFINPPDSHVGKNTYVGDICQVKKLLRTVRAVENVCTSQDTERAVSPWRMRDYCGMKTVRSPAKLDLVRTDPRRDN